MRYEYFKIDTISYKQRLSLDFFLENVIYRGTQIFKNFC